MEKELADFARERLKISRGASDRAVAAGLRRPDGIHRRHPGTGARGAGHAQKTNEPALVLVGRAYNLYDRSVNCDIPRKLRSLYGVNVLPMDFLPVDAEDITRRQPEHVLEFGAANPGRGPASPGATPICTWFTSPTSSAARTAISSRSSMMPPVSLRWCCNSTATPMTRVSLPAAKLISIAKDFCDAPSTAAM